MARRKNEFSDNDKIKILLWCDRHCCLCGKACGVDIEIAHIAPKGPGSIDNAIPLCYDCHARTGHYNREHPRGNRYRDDELKERREQIYEHHTRILVPPLDYRITQEIRGGPPRQLPDVGFIVAHVGDSLPVRVRVVVNIFLEQENIGPPASDLYDGESEMNMNPRFVFSGHFQLPERAMAVVTQEAGWRPTLEARVDVTVSDQYDRAHRLLPYSWVYSRDSRSWYAHPNPRR